MSNTITFPKDKVYKNFGNLLTDVAKEKQDIKSGIIVLFDEERNINVLPCCQQYQCSLAAAYLLAKAVE